MGEKENDINTKIIDELDSMLDEKVELYLEELKKEDNWEEFSLADIGIINIKQYNGKSGLYYFEINFKGNFKKYSNKEKVINEVSSNWKQGSKGKCPKINKKRMRSKELEDYKKQEWIPFYLGKSKMLNERLQEHLTGAKKSKDTYKLNLKNNTSDLFKNCRYRFKVIETKELKGNKYYWVVTRIESKLREEINPICGKQ